MGATDLGPIAWDPAAKALSGTLVGAVGTAAAPWEYHLAFYVPDGFALSSATVGGQPVTVDASVANVAMLRFSLPASAQGQRVPFALAFH
jgi:hypothetical protein